MVVVSLGFGVAIKIVISIQRSFASIYIEELLYRRKEA